MDLPLLPASDFINKCQDDIDGISQVITNVFRDSVDDSCYRPLFLGIFTEVWVSKKGELSLHSVEELLFEYLNKERDRWKQIFGDEALVDSYLRLFALACAIGYFNITDVYGNNYLMLPRYLQSSR